ncbi:hypothetical protein A1O7_06931 [Cladophialophora yegresii CBS 114405]|uniref:Pyridoxamine 5'-phosphate oxidase putative domain-containing protein n=1 Tax=Cladophialophora yegresii CBS 114405 TaxID=1182544 RepID=W9VLJ6_9EURO|nr:uncharacterized protein A1O7_06931 [Cladophialophora yegresii CBS 114405]EXJ56587.1 hypothetical protein A1O7_06931 [Cladophialophora yegresii CBS 114405]
MGQFYETFPPSLVQWLLEQKVFYIASAPLSGAGHVNVSPKGVSDKGGPFFGVIKESKSKSKSQSQAQAQGRTRNPDEESRRTAPADDKDILIRQFWYMDLTGSGIETTSHLHEPGNGRITVMFNAFNGPPRILRIFGKGTPLEYGTPAFDEIVRSQGVTIIPGTRSIVLVDIHQVGTSCGFSMPCYDFVSFRPTLNDFFEKRLKSEREGKREDGIERYWAYKNAWSMDGLPGMQRGVKTALTDNVKPIKKMVGPYAPEVSRVRKSTRTFTIWHLILAAVLGALSIVAVGFIVVRSGSVAVCYGRECATMYCVG